MYCLVCGKRLALLRQLGGGFCCSEQHKRDYAARQAGPRAAAFVPTQPVSAHSETRPESRVSLPIPRFYDVILTRHRMRARNSMGFKGAGDISRLPGAVAPGQARAIAADLSASSPSLTLTASYTRRQSAVQLTAADAVAIGIDPEAAPFVPMASGSVPFVVWRTELQLSRAVPAPASPGAALGGDFQRRLLLAVAEAACPKTKLDKCCGSSAAFSFLRRWNGWSIADCVQGKSLTRYGPILSRHGLAPGSPTLCGSHAKGIPWNPGARQSIPHNVGCLCGSLGRNRTCLRPSIFRLHRAAALSIRILPRSAPGAAYRAAITESY